MSYKPVVGKLITSSRSRGGSFNADQFREKYQEREKAHYDDEGLYLGYNNNVSSEYKEKNTQLSFEMLKRIAYNVAPIGAIINTRVDQVAMFSKIARYSEDGVGFEVKLKDLNKSPTDEELEEILQIENFIENCGAVEDKRRDNFETFLRKGIRDSLIIDQMPFEIIYKDNGEPYEFLAVDGATIRAATEDYIPSGDLEDDVPNEDEEIAFVQVVNGKVVAWFTADELAFPVRNPRTDIDIQPYGLSEIEIIVKQMSSYLESEEYNMRFFQQGGMTKGILNIKEDPQGLANREGLESFKRQWRTQVTGQKGAWKIPVFQLPGEVEFINISQTGGEMVFEKWINYLINIICAVYKIDPAEINFPNNGGVGGRANSLFEGNDHKYKQSKDKGLLPLLRFVENNINNYIVSSFNDKYVFSFKGVSEESEEHSLDIDTKKVTNFMTVNEVRAERGLKEIENGDIILNPYFMQSVMSNGGGGGEFDIEDMDYHEEEETEGDFTETDDEEGMEKSLLRIEILE